MTDPNNEKDDDDDDDDRSTTPLRQEHYQRQQSAVSRRRRPSAAAAANTPPTPPIQDIFSNANFSADTTFYRAVHKIRLPALAHNFSEVESAANRQRCSVITVVKADGYGHSALASAVFLADTLGADAFAVATLEEGIALRKAFIQTAAAAANTPGNVTLLNQLGNYNLGGQNASSNGGHHAAAAAAAAGGETDFGSIHGNSGGFSGGNFNSSLFGGVGSGRRRSMRQGHIRILVLGPPVGFPRCFDDYYHHNIEVMISGPEVAKALLEWVVNKNERLRKRVERAAADVKELILSEDHPVHKAGRPKHLESRDSTISNNGDGPSLGVDNQSIASSSNSGGDSVSGISPQQLLQQQVPVSMQQPLPVQEQQYHPPSATLSNVTGSDLAREVREILKNQKLADQQKQQQQQQQRKSQQSASMAVRKSSTTASRDSGGTLTPASSAMSAASSTQDLDKEFIGVGRAGESFTTATATTTSTSLSSNVIPSAMVLQSNSMSQSTVSAIPAGAGNSQVFGGIEEAAKYSRTRQKAMRNSVFHEGEDEHDNVLNGHHKATQGAQNGFSNTSQSVPQNSGDSMDPTKKGAIIPGVSIVGNTETNADTKARIPTNTNRNALPQVAPPKKRLRWHALVDSGMGRLGFRTDPVSKDDKGKRRDTVEILKELVDLEVTLDCPVEFFGMCTHMADANNATSPYTHSQIGKFKSLLRRVRTAGISVPTISTDNSAALLTTNLTHFDAKELLTQADADSRGFVRTGGAIYGQRPSFPQLQAVSTLMASVRHVATLKEGESVGYDRAYVAKTNVRIATLTIGFADGYPRELGKGVGKVSIRGHLFPVAGNVCMDMLMILLGPAGDKDGIGAQVVVGDTAILWGPDDGEEGDGHVPLKDLAATLNTTQSALTCGLNKERVLRQYT